MKRRRRAGRPLGMCWCGANGAQRVTGQSPDGRLHFGGFPACANHLNPSIWPLWVWDEIAVAMNWEDVAYDSHDVCPVCAAPHGPQMTCEAFRVAANASWPYRRPLVH